MKNQPLSDKVFILIKDFNYFKKGTLVYRSTDDTHEDGREFFNITNEVLEGVTYSIFNIPKAFLKHVYLKQEEIVNSLFATEKVDDKFENFTICDCGHIEYLNKGKIFNVYSLKNQRGYDICDNCFAYNDIQDNNVNNHSDFIFSNNNQQEKIISNLF